MSELKPQIPKRTINVPMELIKEKELTEHKISVYCYLFYNRTLDEHVHYSPIYMLKWCGYSTKIDRHTDSESVYSKFKRCMLWFYNNEYIKEFSEKLYIQNTFQSSEMDISKFNPKYFGIIYDFEFKEIMSYRLSSKRLNKNILLLVLSYIRARCWIRKNEYTGHSEGSKKRKPEIFYSLYKTIGEDINVSTKLVSKAVDILVKLGILAIQTMPCYQDNNGNWHKEDIIFAFKYKIFYSASRFYIDEEYNYSKEIEYGIDFIKNKRYETKEFYQE